MTAVALAGAVAVAAAGAIAALRRRLVVVRVRGDSMLPGYRPGDRVLVRRAAVSSIARGDVVVFEMGIVGSDRRLRADIANRWLIKRAAAVPGDPLPDGVPAGPGAAAGVVERGHLAVLGDNPEASVDSRTAGCVPGDRVLGVVVARLGGGPTTDVVEKHLQSL